VAASSQTEDRCVRDPLLDTGCRGSRCAICPGDLLTYNTIHSEKNENGQIVLAAEAKKNDKEREAFRPFYERLFGDDLTPNNCIFSLSLSLSLKLIFYSGKLIGKHTLRRLKIKYFFWFLAYPNIRKREKRSKISFTVVLRTARLRTKLWSCGGTG